MAMVKSRTATASKKTTKQKPAPRTPLTEAKKDSILDALVTSFARNPDQTLDETRTESSRIAKRLNVSVQSVAAIRAHITMGTYYDDADWNKLVRTRRRELNANAKARTARS